MAGCNPMTDGHQRARTVRPNDDNTRNFVVPLQEDSGDVGADKVAENKDWEKTAEKMEELEIRIVEQFENANEQDAREAFVIKAPVKPTQEQWERHQATLTFYGPWCLHCLAARNVRRKHPTRGRGGKIVLDTEKGDGPTKVSLYYMYFHERIGQFREISHNPPYLVVVEHRYGRCWTHQVLDK